MSNKKKITKPTPVSGFPEWLPEVRAAELGWLDHIRKVFESYGFCSLETPAVEALDIITAKGETDKEIYVLERLQADPDEKKEARLALHFDQTVPFARYVAQHFNDLTFPFKRYQMQKVWRGERPQAGRFREFRQCDIDVINVDNLPLHFDSEMPAMIWEILSTLPGMENENIQLRISNRKILIGLCEALGIENITEVTRIIDKQEKLPREQIVSLLSNAGLNEAQITDLLTLSTIKSSTSTPVLDYVKLKEGGTDLNPEGVAVMKTGAEELAFVLDQLAHLPEGAVVADLSIVRGLDYYTGTVYETVFVEDPAYGSICSGGRYDDLASEYINKALPGVGISIGFSRLFDRLRLQGKLPLGPASPADILMVLPNEDQRACAQETARTLRSRGFKVELYHAPQKLKKQLAYAEKKSIPFVWFPPFEDGQDHEIKNMKTGEQTQVNCENWGKPA